MARHSIVTRWMDSRETPFWEGSYGLLNSGRQAARSSKIGAPFIALF
jgi:hypothetical protein